MNKRALLVVVILLFLMCYASAANALVLNTRIGGLNTSQYYATITISCNYVVQWQWYNNGLYGANFNVTPNTWVWVKATWYSVYTDQVCRTSEKWVYTGNPKTGWCYAPPF